MDPASWGGYFLKREDLYFLIVEEAKPLPGTDELMDYKLMCFHGKVKCSFVCSDRYSPSGLHVTFYDREWNRMPFERHYPSAKKNISKPEKYETMINLAEKLASRIPFARIDFYVISGEIYFGEITLYPGAGNEEFTPPKWDAILGSWLLLHEAQEI